jgi:hypothetical protein
MLDGGFEVDLETARASIRDAEVISLYFPHLRKTLLIDTRTDGRTGPLVAVVEMTNSSQERLRSLRRMRPQFPRPDSITMIPWQRRAGSLHDLGVWRCLEERLTEVAPASPALDEAAACLEELCAYERRELRRAITGEQYHTLWGRHGVSDEAT